MTTLLLSAAGSAVGGAVAGPFGAFAGRLVGSLAGAAIDQALTGGGSSGGARQVDGPRLTDLNVQASSEGTSIPLVYGRARVTGQVIWATRFEEVATSQTQSQTTGGGGGKGGGTASSARASTVSTTYAYFGNFAVGLCEGRIAHLGRIWADGKPLDQAGVVLRFYHGDEAQAPDPLIQAKQGTPDVPAFRGLSYVVFERLPLGPYGNRLPQLSFEVIRPIGRLEERLSAINIIPGAGEFAYHTSEVRRDFGLGSSASENRHTGQMGTDFVASLNELKAVAPNLQHAALVVGWFGDDLRCGSCQVTPGVDIATKVTTGDTWKVGGIERANAHVVSQIDGRAAYGGTPSDASVRAGLRQLKALGLSVTLTPFLFMDVPVNNGRDDPWTDSENQPAYPWRGRITCDPAPGRSGTPDKTSNAANQIAAFFGTASASDFYLNGEDVVYVGPVEWSYRRMVLHNAYLAKASGAVDCFLVGSELVSLTRVRSSRTSFPAVAQLIALADEVRGVLGSGVKVSYAADWTEYGAYVPGDGSADVHFPLDPLWAHSAISFVGIDLYAPLSDWRDGDHEDAKIATSAASRAYLHSRFGAGEAFDWYYADDGARARQTRLAISDGAYGKPWVYRAKDLKSWWSNPHITRLGGIETTATAWQPASKPIRLTEIGIPAVDKGANQPNLFPDQRSSESGFPFASSRARDDFIQRRALEVIIDHFDPTTSEGASANPLSPVYDGYMVDPSASHVWCWDARPWPAYPALADIWGDDANWHTGHWLNGRLGAAPLDQLLPALSTHFAGPILAADDAEGVAQGYVVDRVMSGRSAIEPLVRVYGLDLRERDGALIASSRGNKPVASLAADELAIDGKDDRPRLQRAQETELPASVTLIIADADRDFQRAAVTARRVTGGSNRQTVSEVGLIEPAEFAEAQAELLLRRAWAAREKAEFSLPPSALALEVGDIVTLECNSGPCLLRLTSLDRDGPRKASAEAVDPALSLPTGTNRRPTLSQRLPSPGQAFALVLDLPRRPGDTTAHRPLLAATATPWPGGLTLWRQTTAGFQASAHVARPATIGTLATPLLPGPVWRFDRAAAVQVKLASGALTSMSEDAILDGANVAALRHGNGEWEILQFTSARLVGERLYELTGLLRGQLGSEALAADSVPADAFFVVLDDALLPFPVSTDDIARPGTWRLVPDKLFFDDPAALNLSVTPTGIGLRPLAPTGLKASRDGTGVHISFIRRTRGDGDSWQLAEVPIEEASEAYQVDILSGATVKRSLMVTSPNALYGASDELADFGTPQREIVLRVSQLSAVLGPGLSTTQTLFP